MKSKFRLCSILAAFACVLASGFAWGEDAMMPVIENSNHQEWKYEVSRAVYDAGVDNPTMFACVSNAVEDAESGDELNLLLPVKLAGTSVICIDKVLTLKIKPFEDLSRCQLIFRVLPGGRLTVANTGSFIGAFLVDGGELCLRGGAFYTDGVNPVVSSSQNDSEAKIEIDGAQILGKYQNATKFSQTPAAIDLGGDGSFAMCNGAKVAPYVYSSRYTNIFNTAINVHRGDVRLDNVSIVANDYALAIGYGDDYQGEGVFTVSNMTKLVSVRSGGVYARASTNSIDITLCDTTITSLDGGVKLDYNKGADIQTSMHKHTVEMDGSTTIRTQSLFGDYAIRDVSNCQYWDVDIRRGTYYRMRQSFGDGDETFLATNKWVNPESVASWDPIDAEDNLTMIVTCDKEDEITVIFNGYGSYPAVKDGNTDLEKTQIGFNGTVTNTYYIPHGGSEPLALVTPESIGWTNSMGVFAGWYDSYDNARALKGALTAVPKSMTLYAGWRPCVVSFHHCIDEVVDYFTKTGLARRVVNDTVSIEDFKPATFGNYDNSGHSFVGWYLDKDYSGTAVTSLSVPVATNLYARWIEKSGVAWIEGTTNTYKTVAEAIDAAGGTNVIVLIDNVKDEAPIVVSNQVGIALNGFSLGDAGRAAGHVFELEGTNAYLKIFGEDGTVYGTISVGDNAWLELEGGTCASKDGAVISAGGTNYNIIASGSVFKGPAGDAGMALDLSGNDGRAVISNSTVACVEQSGLVDIAINVENCEEVKIVGSKLTAGFCGLMSSNGVSAVEKSTISAPWGVAAYPSTIAVHDSTVTSSSTNGIDEAYAFYLMDGPKGSKGCSLALSGMNTVVGGFYDTSRAHALLRGGLIWHEGIWENALEGSISGGTYSHQMSNAVVMAWIATNCTCVWESETRFTVKNPDELFDIVYDLRTNLPKEAQVAVDAGTAKFNNDNWPNYLASMSFDFKDASCRSQDGYGCQTEGWYLKDGANTNQVVAISNGCVVVEVNGKRQKTDITGDLVLVAKWGEWMRDPYSISFASGVVDSEFDLEIDFVLMGEDNPDSAPEATQEVLDGLEYDETKDPVALPTADDVRWTDSTGRAHAFSGWVAWYDDPDSDEGGVITSMLYTVSIPIKDIRELEEKGWDSTLHAVWDRGAGLDNFEDLYNDDRAPVMPGGDTYVGVILGGDQTMGSVTVKCGVPNGKGEVSITATVKTAEGGTVTFRGKGVYDGDAIVVDDLENGDHVLSLTLDSKTVSGDYDGYSIAGGVNKFKGSQEDKDEGDLRLKHWLGKWMIIFATEDAQDESYKKKVHGEWEDQDTGKENGSAHACGYSYVILDIKDKGLISVSGKLANGKEVSSTATAIVGDNGVCVPVVCSIYSGYDWFAIYNFVRNYGMRALVPSVTDNFRTTTSRGGFGFTAWFGNSGTNLLNLAAENDSLIVNNVSLWDSSYVKSMPFSATVVPTDAQRVADIKLPGKMAFIVEKDTNSIGWLDNANDENIGFLDEGRYYIPSRADEVPDDGYLQTVSVSVSTNAAYSMKADGKAPKMKLVDADGVPYIVPGKNGSNFSALKLKYNQKNGVFTGSFKIYSLKTNPDFDKTSLKATKVTVSGGVANGCGYGFSHSSAVGSQPVVLVPVGDATPLEPAEDDDDVEGDDNTRPLLRRPGLATEDSEELEGDE